MGLQNSGVISLDDIHVEAGGSTTTTASINDSDIRGLISKTANTQMSFSEWYGASGSWTATMTVGSFISQFFGYSPQFGMGSMSDVTIDNLGNNVLDGLYYSGGVHVNLIIQGNLPNSGWSTLTIGNTVFTRASGSYSYLAPKTYYSWSNVPNPFGTSGTKTITIA